MDKDLSTKKLNLTFFFCEQKGRTTIPQGVIVPFGPLSKTKPKTNKQKNQLPGQLPKPKPTGNRPPELPRARMRGRGVGLAPLSLRRSHAHLSSVTRDPASPALPSEPPSPAAQPGSQPGAEPGAVQTW